MRVLLNTCQTKRTPPAVHTHAGRPPSTMFDGDDGDQDDALRSALRHAVGTICDAGKGRHGLEADPEFVSTLAYVVEKYAKRLATDLPAFAKHGKRSVAGAEDVLLVARDNPDLLRRLTEFVDFHDHRGKPAARKKKKDVDPADAMPGLR